LTQTEIREGHRTKRAECSARKKETKDKKEGTPFHLGVLPKKKTLRGKRERGGYEKWHPKRQTRSNGVNERGE